MTPNEILEYITILRKALEKSYFVPCAYNRLNNNSCNAAATDIAIDPHFGDISSTCSIHQKEVQESLY